MSIDAPHADRSTASALAAALRSRGFTAAALADVLDDGEAAADAHARTLPSPLATAMRLFVLGADVEAADAEKALAPVGIDGAATLGVVRRDGELVRPLVRLVPHDVLVLASDLPTDSPAPDHVAAAHAPSLLLAQLTIRKEVDAALDLGTGNGVQALLLASHAGRVVATDVNERALRFTELNAALNDKTNIETRSMSFLDELPDERYGVVVCNPPYVISPQSGILYRNAELRGDAVSEHLVRTVPGVLEEGGYATILAAWVAGAAEPAPLEWARTGPCDALVVQFRRETAREVAEYWHADLPSAEAEAGVAQWLEFYARESIEEIATGAVVLRRRANGGWRESVEVSGGPVGHAGEHLARLFAAHEGPLTVEGRRFAWAPGVILRRGDRGATTISLERGLGFHVVLDRASSITAAQAAAGAEVGTSGARLVRELVELGFMAPLGNRQAR